MRFCSWLRGDPKTSQLPEKLCFLSRLFLLVVVKIIIYHFLEQNINMGSMVIVSKTKQSACFLVLPSS